MIDETETTFKVEQPPTEKQGLIFEKIPLIMSDIGAVGKDQVNKQQGFKFRGIDDIYNAVQKTMAKHGVCTVPKVIHRKVTEFKTQKGGVGYHHYTENRFRYYASDGSYIDSYTDGEAIDFGDKGTSKALAIAHKYSLLQVFCIPTEDEKDPDANSHKIPPQKKPPAGKPKGNIKKALNTLNAVKSLEAVEEIVSQLETRSWTKQESEEIFGLIESMTAIFKTFEEEPKDE